MMLLILLATLHLILVHTVGGEEVHVNIEDIASIREPAEAGSSDDLLSHNVNCLIGMNNGKYISIRETCKEVIIKLAEYDKMGKEPP